VLQKVSTLSTQLVSFLPNTYLLTYLLAYLLTYLLPILPILHIAACLICSGTQPFRVQVANRAFTRLTQYEQHDIEGETLEFLHGALSDPRATYKAIQESMKTGNTSSEIIAYPQSGHPFVVQAVFCPIITESLYGETNITQLFCFITSTSRESFLSSNIRQITTHEDDASELTGD
jgi:PAS domain-containing protein